MKKLIVVTLSCPLRAEILTVDEMEKRVREEVLVENDLDQSNGFYDYLRVEPSVIVGVRWSPFPTAQFVLDRLPETPLVSLESNGRSTSLNLWFGAKTEFNNSISDDQSFWYNRILEGTDGTIVVTFGLSNVSEFEIDLLYDRVSIMNNLAW